MWLGLRLYLAFTVNFLIARSGVHSRKENGPLGVRGLHQIFPVCCLALVVMQSPILGRGVSAYPFLIRLSTRCVVPGRPRKLFVPDPRSSGCAADLSAVASLRRSFCRQWAVLAGPSRSLWFVTPCCFRYCITDSARPVTKAQIFLRAATLSLCHRLS